MTKDEATMALRCIAEDVQIGEGTRVMSFTNLYGCTIGQNCMIGTFVEIQAGVVIGNQCKIQSHTFICKGVDIEDGVFIGHGVMFTNDRHPRAVREDGEVETEDDWQHRFERTVIKRDACIGSGAVILPGLTIGEGAMVGAGSVVTKDVQPGQTVVGNPARVFVQRDK